MKLNLSQIEPYVKRIERILFIALFLGVLVSYFGYTYLPIQFSLAVLTIVFLIYAFIPANVAQDDPFSSGFKELLAWSIFPKILWLSNSVATLGLTIWSLEGSLQGQLKALASGSLGILFGTIGISILFLTGTKQMNLTILVRSIPILIFSYYVLSDILGV